MAIPVNTSPVRSQRDVRTTRIFTDEFGRLWQATVNNLGVHAGYPVSPIMPLFDAPIYPPPHFLKITDIALGRLRTDVEGWLEQQQAAHDKYEQMKHQTAVLLYGDGAAAAIERGDRALLFRIGVPPYPVERVQAYAEGHPWVLGLDPKKPKSLAPYFPDAPKKPARKFLTAQEEEDQEQKTYEPVFDEPAADEPDESEPVDVDYDDDDDESKPRQRNKRVSSQVQR